MMADAPTAMIPATISRRPEVRLILRRGVFNKAAGRMDVCRDLKKDAWSEG